MHKINKIIHNWGKKVPIRWRLIIASLSVLTILLSSLGVIILFTAGQALKMNEATALRNEAEVVTKSIGGHQHLFPLPPGRPPEPSGPLSQNVLVAAKELARGLSGLNSASAILSPQGNFLAADSASPFVLSPILLSPTVVQQAVANDQQQTGYLLRRDVQGINQIIVFVPLVNSGHTVALLQISTTEQSGGFINLLRFVLVFGVIGAVSLATALTIPLISAALHPLVDMERTSRHIAEGDLSQRLDAPLTDDEIGRLARSFNQMVAQLERSFDRQKRFVADASHELRTPLTALSGSLEMLLLGADSGDKEAARRLMRGMYSEVRRMHRLVEDLLSLTRLDEEQIKLREDAVDVREIIENVYNQAQQLSQGQTIYREVASNTPLMCADADRLQQVLLNIVENALKFTPENGKVALLAYYKKEEEAVLIEVRDTGKGILPEDLPHVFDRFYRADPSRSRLTKKVGGSGLGLAIAKELVEAQGGKIAIGSEIGVGTTLTICMRAVRSALTSSEKPFLSN